ncbi:MAG: nitrile hydratase subunit beta [Acidobacteriota bacterium]|nr:nitrile hydratase subunit beta [Acidobacteriota bacterium]
MDGIHDLGGMHGFGRVEVEVNEPVFHADWEAKVFALTGVPIPDSSIDRFRHAIERLPPEVYLSVGYYGRWLHAAESLFVETGLLAREEINERLTAIEAGEAIPGPAPLRPRADADGPRGAKREVARDPRFAVGDAVVTLEFPIHPTGHTRLPRYARDKEGTVVEVYESYVFPDTNAHGLGESPQHVYCVGFGGRELWGDEAEPETTVHLDLFESYLEPR